MSHTETQQNDKKYEVRDAKIKAITVSGLALVGLIVVAFVIVTALFSHLQKQRAKEDKVVSPFTAERQLPPGPRLQVHPESELRAFLAREDSLVHSYGWIVREAGVVRVPVDTAMEIMLHRGFPVREKQNKTK